MNIKRVTIPGDDIEICGFLYQPESTNPLLGLINLHGWQPYNTKVVETVADIAVTLAQESHATLALAMRGWPDTGGEDDGGEKQPHDVINAATLLIHGDQDQTVPVEQSVHMAEVMEENGKNVTLHVIRGGEHEGLGTTTWQKISPIINNFCTRSLKRKTLYRFDEYISIHYALL